MKIEDISNEWYWMYGWNKNKYTISNDSTYIKNSYFFLSKKILNWEGISLIIEEGNR